MTKQVKMLNFNPTHNIDIYINSIYVNVVMLRLIAVN